MSMIGNLTALDADEFAALLRDPSPLSNLLMGESHDPDVDLYKSWHTVHFLLTGDAHGGEPPLAWAVFCDEEIGEDFTGYGPTRYLTPPQVKQVADALAGLTREELTTRFDPAAFEAAQIYSFNAADANFELQEALRLIDAMTAFYRDAADKGQVVLSYIY